MKVIISLFLLVGSLGAYATPKEYIVRKQGYQIQNLQAIGITGKKVPYFENTFVSKLSDEQVESLIKKGFSVEENGTFTIQAFNKKEIEQDALNNTPKDLWGLKAIKADEANKLFNGQGEGITVCVVDTGVDPDHTDLKGQVVGGEAFVKEDMKGKPAWFDGNGHGTHVAGTIAAKGIGVKGVAPKAKIYVSRVLDSNGSGDYASVAAGIKACIGKSQVINMSLGGPSTIALLEEAVSEAIKEGIVVVAAAGNNGGAIGYPALYTGVVAVSATNSQNKLAYFSSRGAKIEFAAPGVGIISTYPNNKYVSLDGTSMAAPHVAGVAAIMLSRNTHELQATDIKLPVEHQGKGLIDALKTAY